MTGVSRDTFRGALAWKRWPKRSKGNTIGSGVTARAAGDAGRDRYAATPVEECTLAGEGRVAIKAWVDVPPIPCRAGPSRVTVLVCNAEGHGYLLTGQVVCSQEAAVLDGLAEIEQDVRFPQGERSILMQVDSVEDFHFPAAQPTTRRI